MSRRISARLQEAVVCDDELIMEDSLLDEDKLEDAEEGIAAVGEGLEEVVDTPWASPAPPPREVTLEELDATRMYSVSYTHLDVYKRQRAGHHR